MKIASRILITLAVVAVLLTQLAGAATKPSAKARLVEPDRVTQSDLAAIRKVMEQQKQQLEAVKAEMQRKDAAMEETQRQLSMLREAAEEIKRNAAAAQSASTQSAVTVTTLRSDVEVLKSGQASTGTDTQKRLGALEGVVNRFRFSGDVRVRGESFFQSYAGCPTGSCEDRNRVRLRLRLGVEGKLNEDFNAGIYLATGIWSNGSPTFTDPISTNETATGFFEKKTIGLDRGWITYNPVAHKWLSLSGGKFAYTWQRTNYMFDPDLNPEGFSEKFSFDMNHGLLKNVTLQGMQLIFNEASKGRDGKAVGGQLLTKLQPLHAWSVTPSFTLLDWSNIDPIANAADPLAVCKTTVTIGCLPQALTTAVGAPINAPTSTPVVTLANGITNSTVVIGTGAKQSRAFASRFTNADFIIDNSISTPWKRYPLRLLGEYERNLRAANHRDSMYVGLFEVGQQKDKHDLLVGYTFSRTDQDAVLSPFAESDGRSPTNVIQHKFYAGWMVAKNTQAMFTWWHGRVQDVTLARPALNTATFQNNVPISFPTSGFGAFNPLTMKDPWLNRLQMDLIYKF